MAGDDELSFTLPVTGVNRGDTITVRIHGDRSQYRSARLELLQVERKPKAVLDPKANNAQVVHRVDIGEMQSTVQLSIPASLPNQYHGTRVGWDYEVRLVGDRAKRTDHEQVEPLQLVSRVPVAGTDSSLQSLCTSQAASLAGLDSDAHEKARAGSTPFGIIGVIGIVIGVATGNVGWLVAGGLMFLLGALGWYTMYRAKQHSIGDVDFEPTQKVVRLGEPVVMKVGNAIGHSLEMGLQAIEITIEQGNKGRLYGVQHIAFEHWTPVTGTTVTLPTRVDQVAGFVGDRTAVHWVAVLRKAEGSDRVKTLSARTILLAVTH